MGCAIITTVRGRAFMAPRIGVRATTVGPASGLLLQPGFGQARGGAGTAPPSASTGTGTGPGGSIGTGSTGIGAKSPLPTTPTNPPPSTTTQAQQYAAAHLRQRPGADGGWQSPHRIGHHRAGLRWFPPCGGLYRRQGIFRDHARSELWRDAGRLGDPLPGAVAAFSAIPATARFPSGRPWAASPLPAAEPIPICGS